MTGLKYVEKKKNNIEVKNLKNMFDKEEMRQICKELNIEIVEGVKCPQYKNRDMTVEDIENIFKEDVIEEYMF